MLENTKQESIDTVICEALASAECDLYAYRLKRGRNPELTVYLDDVAKPVTIDDCTRAARHLRRFLALLEDGSHWADCVLEVSSPGIRRQLFTPEHYERVMGQMVDVKLKTPISAERGKKLRAQLTDYREKSLLLLEGEEQLEVPHDQIVSVCLVGDL